MSIYCIEDYVRGKNGVAADGLIGRLRDNAVLAERAGVDRIRIEVRVHPDGESSSRAEQSYQYATSDDVDALADRLVEILQASPGDAYRGEIRTNFHAMGAKNVALPSFTRSMQPPRSKGDAVPIAGSTDVEYWSGIARRHAAISADVAEQFAKLTGVLNVALQGSAMIITAHARATGRILEPSPSGASSALPDLLRGVLRLGEQAGGPAGAAAGAAAAMLPPPPPPPSSTGAQDAPSLGGSLPPLPDPSSSSSSTSSTPSRADVARYLETASDEDAKELAGMYLDKKGLSHLKGMLP